MRKIHRALVTLGASAGLILGAMGVASPASAFTAQCTSDNVRFLIRDNIATWAAARQTYEVCWGPYGHFTSATQKVNLNIWAYGVAQGMSVSSNPSPTKYYATSDDQRFYWFGSVHVCYPWRSPVCLPAMTMGGYTRTISPAAGGWLKTYDIHKTDTSGGWSWFPSLWIQAGN